MLTKILSARIKEPHRRGIARDYYGNYHFQHKRLGDTWGDLSNPFHVNRLQALIGLRRRLYPAHDVPSTIQLYRGIPQTPYIGTNEQSLRLDKFHLLHVGDSGVAAIEVAGEKFSLAVGESKAITRWLVHIL